MNKTKHFLLLVAAAALSGSSFALDLNNPLPNWIDVGRETADGKPPFASDFKPAPPAGFRIPAEYEPIGAVVLSWAGYTGMLTGIAKAAAGPGGAKVWVVSGPGSIQGVTPDAYSSISAPIDTVWVRDYGPFGLTASGQPGIVDTIYRHYQYRRGDDAVPQVVAKTKNIPVFAMPLVLDGGNLMVDSKGNLFTTKRTYIWNSDKSTDEVDSLLKAYFGVKKVIALDYAGYPGQPADGTGHIDMFAKLLNDNTVLIAVADKEPYKSNSEKAIAWFNENSAPNGDKYKVITVKGWSGGAWYTYTNSLLVNNVAIIPSYSGHAAEEAAAKAAYEEGIPGVTVVPVPSDDSIRAGGSIHCTTQSIPRGNGIKTEEAAAPKKASVPAQPVEIKADGAAMKLLQSLTKSK